MKVQYVADICQVNKHYDCTFLKKIICTPLTTVASQCSRLNNVTVMLFAVNSLWDKCITLLFLCILLQHVCFSCICYICCRRHFHTFPDSDQLPKALFSACLCIHDQILKVCEQNILRTQICYVGAVGDKGELIRG